MATLYEFQLTSSPCSRHGGGCELMIDIPLPSGLLLGSFVDQSVSLDLNSAGVTLGGGEYHYSVRATNAAGSAVGDGGTFEAPGSVIEPLGATASPLSGAGQPVGSNSGDQPAGSGGSSSSTAGVKSLGSAAGQPSKLKALTNAQKLSKALKVCKQKPKRKRAQCEKHARRKYGTTASKA